MSFVIFVRNPSSKSLFPVIHGDGDSSIKEFPSHEAARREAERFPWYEAWVWDIVEIDV